MSKDYDYTFMQCAIMNVSFSYISLVESVLFVLTVSNFTVALN